MKPERSVVFTALIAMTIIILLVSIVSASDIPSTSSARAASATPLPVLHFNDSQEKVAVTGELSPGKNIQITQGLLLTTSRSAESLTIPVGSIIYHTAATTTVFDQTGQQLFVADDDQAASIPTFRTYLT